MQVTQTHPLDTANKDANLSLPQPLPSQAMVPYFETLRASPPLTLNPLSFPWLLMPTCCLQ